MLIRKRTIWWVIALVALTFAELKSLCQAAFCVWMTAYRPEYASGWRVILYRWLAAAAIIAGLWIWVAFKLWLGQGQRVAR
jgi:hypothetical protein